MRRRAVAGLAALVLAAGCTSHARADDAATTASAPAPAAVAVTEAARTAPVSTTIRIDGAFDDWPAGAYLAADGQYVYVRLTLPEARTIQASEQPLVLALDARAAGAFEPELRITFSPRETGGQGVAVPAVSRPAAPPAGPCARAGAGPPGR